MKIISTRVLETCIDGTKTLEMTLDRPVGSELIHLLGRLGTLEYFSMLARPFFRVTRNSAFVLKGVEGECSLEIFLVSPESEPEKEIAALIRSAGNLPESL